MIRMHGNTVHDFPVVRIVKRDGDGNNVNRFQFTTNKVCQGILPDYVKVSMKSDFVFLEKPGLDASSKNVYKVQRGRGSDHFHCVGINLEEGYYALVEEDPGHLFKLEKHDYSKGR